MLLTQVILSTNFAYMIRKVAFHLHVRSLRMDYANDGCGVMIAELWGAYK